MSEEDYFVQLVSKVESDHDPEAWGDGGYACGRFQDHARYYADWGPLKSDFGGRERSWDWCFEFACRKFFRVARAHKPTATLLEIGMARHLHGAVVWTGLDDAYEASWLKAEQLLVKPDAT
jgi:hypothetical protein